MQFIYSILFSAAENCINYAESELDIFSPEREHITNLCQIVKQEACNKLDITMLQAWDMIYNHSVSKKNNLNNYYRLVINHYI